MDHTPAQVEALLRAHDTATARTLADALLAACAPHGTKAFEAAQKEITRRSTLPA